MLNEQNCDHLIAIRLSAWNQFVVLVGSPIGNNADMSAHCSRALSEFPVERARSQWVWKPNFLFSQPSLLRFLLYQCQSWIRAARLCMLPWPWRPPVQEGKGEVSLLPCEDVSLSPSTSGAWSWHILSCRERDWEDGHPKAGLAIKMQLFLPDS